MSCFGVDGKPVMHKAGFAEVRFEFDRRWNLVSVSRFDVNGKLIAPDDKPADGKARQ